MEYCSAEQLGGLQLVTIRPLFSTAASERVTVLPVLGYGTAWATGSDLKRLPATAMKRGAFARFARAVVARYGVHGTFWEHKSPEATYPITAVEVWNEPWYPGPSSPELYAALVLATSKQIKAADPGIKVLANIDDRVREKPGGTLVNWGYSVLDALPKHTAAVDGWAIHPYPRAGRPSSISSVDDSLAQVADMRARLREHDQAGAVWITECGFSDVPSAPDLQGSSTSSAYALAKVVNMWAASVGPNPVTHFYGFTYSRQDTPGRWDDGYDLLNRDGTQTPALQRLAQVARGLGREE